MLSAPIRITIPFLTIIRLTFNNSTADLISLEELVSLMSVKKLFSPALQQTLFAIICTSKQNIPLERRRGAVILLTMMNKESFGSAVNALENIVIERMESFLASTIKLNDPLAAKYACVMLQRIGMSNVIGKLEASNPTVALLLELIQTSCSSPPW
jgi:hypothetical protein